MEMTREDIARSVVEEFMPNFARCGRVIHNGSGMKRNVGVFSEDLSRLGVSDSSEVGLPDVVIYVPDRDWVYLIECASHGGPIDESATIPVAGSATQGAEFDTKSIRPQVENVSLMPNNVVALKNWGADQQINV